MGSSLGAWQNQVTISLLLLGGGYIAFVNKWPPFNKGGIIDQLRGLLPKSDNSSSDDSSGDGSDSGGDNGKQQPSLPMPTTPIPSPPGASNMGPMLPMSPFQGGHTAQDETVYENYVKGLNFLYGQGNKANVSGNPNVPFVGGDANLGTTPVPSGLVSPTGSGMAPSPPNQYGGPMGSPYYGYSPQMQQQLGFPGPTTIPTQPFLPNPTQYPGPTQPSPYPAYPSSPFPQGPQLPLPPLPPFYADLGVIDPGFRGLSIAHLIRIGIPIKKIFPHGLYNNDIKKINKDIKKYIHKLLNRIHSSRSGSLMDIIRTEIAMPTNNNSGGLGGILGLNFNNAFSARTKKLPSYMRRTAYNPPKIS